MRESFTRRHILELGIGSAILGVCSGTAANAGMPRAISNQEGNRIPALKEFNTYGEELERFLLLRTSPVAVKMLKSQADIPKGALRPKKDKNKH